MDATALDKIDRFVEHLRTERRLSDHTRSGYRRDLMRLAEFCDGEDIADWRALNNFHLRRFAAACHRKGLAARSIQRRLSAARTFFEYLVREGVLTNNPGVDVSAPKTKKPLPKTMDVDRVNALLKSAAREPLAIRDFTIMELMYSSGLRLAELVGLDLDDLDLDDRSVTVLGKGAKTRVLPIGKQAVHALRAWLKLRGSHAADGETAVFVSQRGTRLSPRSVQARLKFWARKQGLDVNVHPHLLRHSFASHILESSGDLRAVQELLGHANVSTTQVYTHLDFQHLARTYDKAHPRARKKPEKS